MTTTVIRERPILFSGPMVRAILDGRKTQTRRTFKLPRGLEWYVSGMMTGEAGGAICGSQSNWWGHVSEMACPYGSPGDRLWVRESLRGVTDTKFADGELMPICAYAADGSHIWSKTEGYREPWTWTRPTLPSIHMPRWACRIVLEITSVRVERLQEITEADAHLEGFQQTNTTLARSDFIRTWKLLNGVDSWSANPWVWVVNFKREIQ